MSSAKIGHWIYWRAINVGVILPWRSSCLVPRLRQPSTQRSTKAVPSHTTWESICIWRRGFHQQTRWAIQILSCSFVVLDRQWNHKYVITHLTPAGMRYVSSRSLSRTYLKVCLAKALCAFYTTINLQKRRTILSVDFGYPFTRSSEWPSQVQVIGIFKCCISGQSGIMFAISRYLSGSKCLVGCYWDGHWFLLSTQIGYHFREAQLSTWDQLMNGSSSSYSSLEFVQ